MDHNQLREARLLCEAVGISLENGGGVEALRLFQQYLDDFSITVFSDRKGTKVMFKGPPSTPEHERKHIDLIYGENHFNVILSLTGAFSCSYYCRECNVPYDHKDNHFCKKSCTGCNYKSVCSGEAAEKIDCPQCNRFFANRSCFENHTKPQLVKGKSMCDILKFCTVCKKIYNTLRRKGNHVCGESFCITCDSYKPSNHLCHIRPESRKTVPKNFLYVYFDFECTQETEMPDNPNCFLHVPNLCVMQQSCHSCISSNNIDEPCSTCGPRQHTFSGESTLGEFMNHVVSLRTTKEFKNVVLIAHNMKAYDGQFVLKHMVEVLKWNPKVIMTQPLGRHCRLPVLHAVTTRRDDPNRVLLQEVFPKCQHAGGGYRQTLIEGVDVIFFNKNHPKFLTRQT
jgi:hypothetical protein